MTYDHITEKIPLVEITSLDPSVWIRKLQEVFPGGEYKPGHEPRYVLPDKTGYFLAHVISGKIYEGNFFKTPNQEVFGEYSLSIPVDKFIANKFFSNFENNDNFPADIYHSADLSKCSQSERETCLSVFNRNFAYEKRLPHEQKPWLFIGGARNSGKTFLGISFIKKIFEKAPVGKYKTRYYTMSDIRGLFTRLRSSDEVIGKGASEEFLNLLSAGVLFIDDLSTENLSQYEKDHFGKIISHRKIRSSDGNLEKMALTIIASSEDPKITKESLGDVMFSRIKDLSSNLLLRARS